MPQTPLRASLPQHADLQSQLQTKQLETQILQQSLQAEILKQQLHQISSQNSTVQRQPSSVAISPPPPAVPAPLSPPAVKPSDAPAASVASSSPSSRWQQAVVDESRPGGVKTLTRNYEHKAYPSVTPGLFQQPPTSPRRHTPGQHTPGQHTSGQHTTSQHTQEEKPIPPRKSVVMFSDEVYYIIINLCKCVLCMHIHGYMYLNIVDDVTSCV